MADNGNTYCIIINENPSFLLFLFLPMLTIIIVVLFMLTMAAPAGHGMSDASQTEKVLTCW